MLGATVSIGILGYLGAAKDRSDLDFKEVLTRTPISGAYAIFGSDLFEEGFKSMLYKSKKFMSKYPDLIQKTKDELFEVPSKLELDKQLKDGIIDKAAHANKMRGKAIISGIPFAFSLVVMGFVVAGMTRFWTQYRYNKMHKDDMKARQEKEQQAVNREQKNEKLIKVTSFGNANSTPATNMTVVSSKQNQVMTVVKSKPVKFDKLMTVVSTKLK